MSEPEEYTDKQTSIRLTVERDDPDWPRITGYAPEGNTLTSEEVDAAIRRLVHRAGYDEVIRNWVTVKDRKP